MEENKTFKKETIKFKEEVTTLNNEFKAYERMTKLQRDKIDEHRKSRIALNK